MKYIKSIKKYFIIDTFFLIGFIVILFLNIFKSKFGSGGADEAFYLTIPNRLLNGDLILLNEWHPSQLVGVLMIPFLKIYYSLFQNNDGILLHFRYIYIYIAVNSIVTIVVYLNLRKASKLGSCAATLLYFLYTPFSIVALSYNTIGLLAFLLSGCLLLEDNKLKNFFSGIFFSIGVLSNPYMIAVFFIYTIIVIFNIYFIKSEIFSKGKYILYLLGIIISGLIFILYFLSKGGGEFLRLLKSLSYILNEPEHLPRTIGSLLHDYSQVFYFINDKFIYIYSLMLAVNIISIFFVNKKLIYKNILIGINSTLLCYIFYKLWYFSQYFVNYIMFPIILVGLTFFILSKNRNYNVFTYLYVFGILYSFFMNISSNTHVWAISTATTLSVVASCIHIADYIQYVYKEENYNIKNKNVYSIVLISIIVFCSHSLLELKGKINYVFYQTPIKYQTELLDYGVAKNIIVTPEEKENYDNTYKIYNELKKYVDFKNDTILYIDSKNTMWLYIQERNKIPSYSAWMGYFTQSDIISNRLKEYYELYPEEKPKWVYIDKSFVNQDYLSVFPRYRQNQLENGVLLKILIKLY